jgi:uncharacterized protein (DUF1778 family)
MEITGRETEAFLAALDSPLPPNEKLCRAAERYRTTIEGASRAASMVDQHR